MDLSPANTDSVTASYLTQWSPSELSASNSSCHNAGLKLPNGAKLVRVLVYFQSDTNSNLFLNIFEGDPASGNVTPLLASGNVNDNTGTRKLKAVNFPANTVVKSNLNHYGVGVCVNNGTKFFGARIQYTTGN